MAKVWVESLTSNSDINHPLGRWSCFQTNLDTAFPGGTHEGTAAGFSYNKNLLYGAWMQLIIQKSSGTTG